MSLRLGKLSAKLLDRAESQARTHGHRRLAGTLECIAKTSLRLGKSSLGNVENRQVNLGLEVIGDLAQVGLEALTGLLGISGGVVERRQAQLDIQELSLLHI